METRANHVLIGLFTLAVLAGAFGFVYWLVRFGEIGTRDEIDVVFSGSVAGLNAGSPVLFNGLKVGEVETLALDPRNPGIVRARINVDSNLPLKIDTKAQIEFQGLTGAGYLQFSGGKPESPRLIEGPGTVPEIFASGASFQDLIEGARSAVGQANAMFARIDGLIEKNAGPLGEVIANARDMTANLKASSARIDGVIGSIETFSTSFRDVSKKIEGLVTNLDKVVTAVDTETVTSSIKNVETFTGALANNAEKINAIGQGATELVAKLNGIATRVDGVVGKVDGMVDSDGKGFITEATEAARSFRKLAQDLEQRVGPVSANLERFSGNGLRNLETFITDGRRTLSTFDRVISNLERNPSQFLLGGNRVQEYTPRR